MSTQHGRFRPVSSRLVAAVLLVGLLSATSSAAISVVTAGNQQIGSRCETNLSYYDSFDYLFVNQHVSANILQANRTLISHVAYARKGYYAGNYLSLNGYYAVSHFSTSPSPFTTTSWAYRYASVSDLGVDVGGTPPTFVSFAIRTVAVASFEISSAPDRLDERIDAWAVGMVTDMSYDDSEGDIDVEYALTFHHGRLDLDLTLTSRGLSGPARFEMFPRMLRLLFSRNGDYFTMPGMVNETVPGVVPLNLIFWPRVIEIFPPRLPF